MAANPNLTKEQFLSILSSSNKANLIRILLSSFVKGHPQKENLQWVWNLVKEQKEETVYLCYFVGFHAIIYLLDKEDSLTNEMANYFLNLNGQKFNSPELGSIPLTEYGFVLEYLVQNTKDLDQYDKYVDLYKEYQKEHYKNKPQYYDESSTLVVNSRNKYLDDNRAKDILNKLNDLDLPSDQEQTKAHILSNLLKSENISKELFLEIFESRKRIKNKSLINYIFAGAASNNLYLQEIYDILYSQMTNGFNRSRDLIFFSILENSALTDSQYFSIVDIIEKQFEDKDFLKEAFWDVRGLNGKLTDFIKKLIEKKPNDKENIKRILGFYFDYLFKLGEDLEKDTRRFLGFFRIPVDVISEINLDQELFDFIINKTNNNLFRNQIFGSLLKNKSLSEIQYKKLESLLNPIYFRGDRIFLPTEHSQGDPNTPDFVLKNWASSIFVK